MYGIYSAIKPEKETVVKCPRKRRRPLPSLPLHGILWPYKSQRKPTNKGGRGERREEKRKKKENWGAERKTGGTERNRGEKKRRRKTQRGRA